MPKRRYGFIVRCVESMLVVIVLLVFFKPESQIVGLAIDDSKLFGIPGDPKFWYRHIVVLIPYIVSVIWLARNRNVFFDVLLKERWVLILVGLALSSVLWSISPIYTIRESLFLSLTTLYGVYVALRFSIRELLLILAVTSTIVVILSIFVALMFPEIGTHDVGNWRGILFHKNALGTSMLIGALAFICLALDMDRYRLVYVIGCLLCIITLILTMSKTAQFTFLVLVVCVVIFLVKRTCYREAAFAGTALVVVASATILYLFFGINFPLFVANALHSVSSAFPTLTENQIIEHGALLSPVSNLDNQQSRLELWNELFKKIQEHFWLGHGFDAFWADKARLTSGLWNQLQWEPRHSHNGYVELWLGLGFLGVVAFVVGFLRTLTRIGSARPWRLGAIDMFPLLYLVVFIMLNLAYSKLPSDTDAVWFLYVAVVILTIKKWEPSSLVCCSNKH